MGRDILLELYRCRESVCQGKAATSSGASPGEILKQIRLFSLVVCVLTIPPRCIGGETNAITTNSTLLSSNVFWLSNTNPVGSRALWGSPAKGGFGAQDPFYQPPPTWLFINQEAKFPTSRKPTALDEESDT